MLADTSAWINHLRGIHPIPEEVVLVTVPPVLQEVLHGADLARSYDLLREVVLSSATMLDNPMPLERFEQAAQIYLRCRDKGYTPRSSVDCLIAASAIAHDAELLHDDRDFGFIAEVVPLRLFSPSRPA
ncbi:MAG TPA: PIN domain-containing protein [Thermoanaerobaculia bacterium]